MSKTAHSEVNRSGPHVTVMLFIDVIIFVIVVINELFCRLIEEQESQPDFWFRERCSDMWRENKLAVSEFLGSKPDNLVFVHNTTTGCYLYMRPNR